MPYRKLRIAWSIFWAAAALFLVVLWMRSYVVVDGAILRFTARYVGEIGSAVGTVIVGLANVAEPSQIVQIPTAEWVDSDTPTPSPIWGALINDGTVTGVAIPTWLLVGLCIGIGAAPWISQSCRFSLRSLLVATTLAAAVLGLVASSSR